MFGGVRPIIALTDPTYEVEIEKLEIGPLSSE